MDTMVISEFKAKCIGVMKNINRTRKPLTITLRGTPVARVEPIRNQLGKRSLGTMRGTVKINRILAATAILENLRLMTANEKILSCKNVPSVNARVG